MGEGGFNEENEEYYDYQGWIVRFKDDINKKLNSSYKSFKLNKVYRQIVAGEFFHLHLTSDNGHKVSICIFVPLEHPDEPLEL